MVSRPKKPLTVTFPEGALGIIQHIFRDVELCDCEVDGAMSGLAYVRPKSTEVTGSIPFITEDFSNGTFGIYGPNVLDSDTWVYFKLPLHSKHGPCLPALWKNPEHEKVQRRLVIFRGMLAAFHAACLNQSKTPEAEYGD